AVAALVAVVRQGKSADVVALGQSCDCLLCFRTRLASSADEQDPLTLFWGCQLICAQNVHAAFAEADFGGVCAGTIGDVDAFLGVGAEALCLPVFACRLVLVIEASIFEATEV